ncbi:anaphase-promoting complex, cyclosome, subunit 4-domain-containing protein [Naematelia encephala]|uniref:Anaphase-promoting complex subunit 4 n=1 Tax=Naematelia encephala TaxID=71784 RepID=A0A1Y2BEV8_9TREE|nr:anaphase-promoting complex, cyclosome, subunit 4-domain-containing protein [Naematelia encephala]
MLFPDSNSFTRLATISRDQPHALYPQACNPTMDLVALLSSAGNNVKGKGRADQSSTKVELWRMMSGGKVWEADVNGEVEGLAWSRDGLQLSLLIVKYPSLPSSFLQPSEHWRPVSVTVDHLSVHSGHVIKSVSLDIPDKLERGWWDMEWTSEGASWPKPSNGSRMLLIDSLPRPTIVEPPKPANMLPFALPAVAKTENPTAHPKLTHLPSLLPSPVDPDVLLVSSPGSSTQQRLLTGTFPLPALTPQYLSLALASERLSGYLDIVLRGLEAAEHAFREGEKQTMIWREDLEACAEQQGMTRDQVHADLFRLLMTGRSDVAVSEWLGKNLTARTIAKWEQALDTAYATIRKVISESISPALERIVLLLEEMQGWVEAASLALDKAAIETALSLCAGFATALETMRQDASHEAYCAAEFMKWLKYEMTRTTAADQSSDAAPTSMHDLKYTWAFIQTAFVASPFQIRFPNKGRDDILDVPDSVTALSRPLDVLLNETAAKLDRSAPADDLSSPPLASVSFDNSISMELATEDVPEPSHLEQPAERKKMEEPWTWLNSVIQKCDEIVSEAARNATQQWSMEHRGPLADRFRVGTVSAK